MGNDIKLLDFLLLKLANLEQASMINYYVL